MGLPVLLFLCLSSLFSLVYSFALPLPSAPCVVLILFSLFRVFGYKTMHFVAHTLVDWESEDYPQTVCIRPEMHEESTLCVCFVSSVGDLNCTVSRPWRGESLGFFAPR